MVFLQAWLQAYPWPSSARLYSSACRSSGLTRVPHWSHSALGSALGFLALGWALGFLDLGSDLGFLALGSDLGFLALGWALRFLDSALPLGLRIWARAWPEPVRPRTSVPVRPWPSSGPRTRTQSQYTRAWSLPSMWHTTLVFRSLGCSPCRTSI